MENATITPEYNVLSMAGSNESRTYPSIESAMHAFIHRSAESVRTRSQTYRDAWAGEHYLPDGVYPRRTGLIGTFNNGRGARVAFKYELPDREANGDVRNRIVFLVREGRWSSSPYTSIGSGEFIRAIPNELVVLVGPNNGPERVMSTACIRLPDYNEDRLASDLYNVLNEARSFFDSRKAMPLGSHLTEALTAYCGYIRRQYAKAKNQREGRQYTLRGIDYVLSDMRALITKGKAILAVTQPEWDFTIPEFEVPSAYSIASAKRVRKDGYTVVNYNLSMAREDWSKWLRDNTARINGNALIKMGEFLVDREKEEAATRELALAKSQVADESGEIPIQPIFHWSIEQIEEALEEFGKYFPNFTSDIFNNRVSLTSADFIMYACWRFHLAGDIIYPPDWNSELLGNSFHVWLHDNLGLIIRRIDQFGQYTAPSVLTLGKVTASFSSPATHQNKVTALAKFLKIFKDRVRSGEVTSLLSENCPEVFVNKAEMLEVWLSILDMEREWASSTIMLTYMSYRNPLLEIYEQVRMNEKQAFVHSLPYERKDDEKKEIIRIPPKTRARLERAARARSNEGGYGRESYEAPFTERLYYSSYPEINNLITAEQVRIGQRRTQVDMGHREDNNNSSKHFINCRPMPLAQILGHRIMIDNKGGITTSSGVRHEYKNARILKLAGLRLLRHYGYDPNVSHRIGDYMGRASVENIAGIDIPKISIGCHHFTQHHFRKMAQKWDSLEVNKNKGTAGDELSPPANDENEGTEVNESTEE